MRKLLLLTGFIAIFGVSVTKAQTVPTYFNNNLIHQIHYSTYDQDMWGPGDAFFLDFEYELFNIEVNEDFQIGVIEDVFGAQFGLMVDMGIWMYFNLTFSISGFTGGSIDIEYPVEITLEFPDDYTFDQGQTIAIHSSYEVLDGWALDTYFPEAGIVALVFRYGFGMHFDIIVCMFTCETIPIIPSIGFPINPYSTDPLPHDSIALFYLNGQTGEVAYPCVDADPIIPGLPGICHDTILPIIIPDWFGIGLTGEIDLPYVETEDWLDPNTQCLHAYGQDPWLQFEWNLMQFLSFIAGFIPPPNGPAIQQAIDFLAGGVIEYEIMPGVTAVIDYYIIQLYLTMTNWMTQDFSFCPTIWATLEFPTELEFTETDPSNNNEVVNSGVDDLITFAVNNDVNIVYPCYDWDEMEVISVTYDITSGFTNHTYDSIAFDFILNAIFFQVTIPIDFPWKSMPEFELPEIVYEDKQMAEEDITQFISPEIITPEFILSGFMTDENVSVVTKTSGANNDEKDLEFCFPPNCEPLISETFPLFSFDLTWFNDTWDIEGFEQGITFDGTWLIPNPPLDIEVESQDVICFGDSTGVITVTAISSAGPYTYEYSNGVVNTHMGPTDQILVPAGYYYITLTDVYGCEQFGEVNILDENPPLISSLYSTDVLCHGEPTGTLTAYVSGGVPPYEFFWSPSGSTEQNPEGVYAGWHYLTITDAVGCEHYDSVFIDQPDEPLMIEYEAGMVSCHGLSDGYIDITVTGGTPPYSYLWSNGLMVQDLINIPAGNYTITVTDAHNCEIERTYVITQPEPLELIMHTQDVLCYGENTGQILLNVTGGTPPYEYLWSNGATTQHILNVYAGIYSVTVTDDNGCQSYGLAQIEQPALPLTAVIVPTHVRCFGEGNGIADLTVFGGTPPYYYQWSNGEISEDIEDLVPGIYSVTVTDNHNCLAYDTVQIFQPEAPMQGTITGNDITCHGGTDGNIYIEVEGGWPYDHPDYDYIFVWSNGSWQQNQLNVGAGTYTVTVSDAEGCHYEMEITLGEPDEFIVEVMDEPTICHGMIAEIGLAMVQGGTEPYTILWENGGFGYTTFVQPLETTSYSVSVYDALECESEVVDITVFVHDTLNIEINTDNDIVCPGDTIEFNVSITGGGITDNFVTVNDSLMEAPFRVPIWEETTFEFMVYDACGYDSITTNYTVNTHPLPPVSVSVDKEMGCSPLTVMFSENSEHIGQSYVWDFDDGEFVNLSFDKNPVHTFTNPTTYHVHLRVISDEYCINDTIVSITAFPVPEANFVASSDDISLLNPLVHFTNMTEGGFFYNWDFGDGSGSSNANPSHTYSMPGTYYVLLEATSLYGCKDTTGLILDVRNELAVWAPTAFTPNFDNLNETFKVIVEGIDPKNYDLQIYSRWGEKVFHGTHYDQEWDGRYNLIPCEPGVYAWVVTYTDNFGNEHTVNGIVTLLK
jgi:gliding motility-associated-like protein